MASKSPTHTVGNKITEETQASHRGHRITKVGSVSVDQSQGGGTFTVWYCQDDHTLLSDVKSVN